MNNVAIQPATVAPTLRPCPLCDSEVSTPEFEGIRKCEECGFRFVNPLGYFHGEHESDNYFVSDYLTLHKANWENSLEERRAHLRMISSYADLPANPALLDLGCALGFMLKEAKAAGWKATGVETSEFAARYAADFSGCLVHQGTVQDGGFRSESFDVITMMDVIEHVVDLRSLMSDIHRLLRPGGVLFLITPNFNSLFVKLYGSQAYGIGPDEHANYFQPSTMRRLLRDSGFRNIDIRTKDLYAANLARLSGRTAAGEQCGSIKSAFSKQSRFGFLRRLGNYVFAHIHIGDKLIALARK